MNNALAHGSSLVGLVVEDRYRIEELLGAGAMGVVYRARHLKVGRSVAIKVLHEHLVRDPEMVDRFEREARLAARLRHRNLVAVIDLGSTVDGQKLMILELAPGQCLADLVVAPMARPRVIDLTRQLLCGLEHAHALGLVHRDLKPENVLVERTADGAEIPRIVDFGIAILRDRDDSVEGRRLTSSGMVLGTPLYMSPEQATGERVDARADLFSLGVIVYEMLSGTTPFVGSGVVVMMQNISCDPPSVATRAGLDVDPLLEAFARKLMARSLGDRFASATEALLVLDLIDRDRDAATRALGLEVAVPRHAVHDAIATRRHHITRSAMPPIVGTLRAANVEGAGVEGPPSRRGRWGAMLGAAAVIVGALGIALWMGASSRSEILVDAPQVELPCPTAELIEIGLHRPQCDDQIPTGLQTTACP